MTETTDVVIALAGPYTEYGQTLLRACVDSHTHYCDITGDYSFLLLRDKICVNIWFR